MQSKRLASAIFINNLIAFACCRRANVKTMMRLAASALGVALVVFGSSCARADILTYTATGPVIGASTSPLMQQFIGQPSTFTFSLNTAIADQDPRSLAGVFLGGLVSGSGSVGSYHFSTGAGDLRLGKAPNEDILSFSTMSVTGPPVGGANLVAVGFELRDFTRTALQTMLFPLSFDLSKFNKKN